MKSQKIDGPIYHCIDCRWCELHLDLERGSNYYCLRKRRKLTYDVIHRVPCAQFAPNSPAPHWGP